MHNDKTIFHEAVEIASRKARSAFLAGACEGDADQLRRVESLLSQHDKGIPFMDLALPELIISDLNEVPEAIVGARIGPYLLREQIGEGGMGIVFVAEQTEPVQRKVALKVIKPGIDTKEVIARFEAERQALAIMDHPNIAKVLEAGSTQSGRPYFVMDLVRGRPITRYCDEHRLGTLERLELFSVVCQAIQHAHQKGIIHRDLKPGNLLVTRVGSRGVPKVIDFGVAKAINRRLTEKTIYTRFSQMIGTPMYMSPEQAELTDLDTDTRSDVYSLGVVLYELLTGSTPFEKEELHSASYDEMRRMIREIDPPRPSERISTLSAEALSTICDKRGCEVTQIQSRLKGELDWIVMKALEKDRNRRYGSASALAADIQRYLSDEPVEACPPSTAYRFKKLVKKHRLSISTVGLVVVALLFGLVGTSWQAMQATLERNDKRIALSRLTAALGEKEAALAIASSNLAEANLERERASANLTLAMQAVDDVYLNSIGGDNLFRQQLNWVLMPGDSLSFQARMALGDRSGMSRLDVEQVAKGLRLYEQISRQNASSDEAVLESAKALVRIAQIQSSLGQPGEARVACRQAIEFLQPLAMQTPTNPNHWAALGEAYFQRGQLDRWTTDSTLDLEEAIRCADQAIDLAPGTMDPYRLRGKSYLALAEFDQALPDFEKLIAIDPDNATYHGDLGRLCFHRNEIEKSQLHLRRAIELDPKDISRNSSRHFLAESYLHSRGEDWTSAAEVWESALPHATETADENRIRFVVHRLRSQYQSTIDLADTWESGGGDSYDLYLARAGAFAELGKRDRALADLKSVMQLAENDPHAGWAIESAGDIFHWLGANDRAIEAYRLAIEKNPNGHDCYYGLGFLLDIQRRYDEAIEVFGQGIAIAPRYVPLYQSRAYSQFKLGNYSETIADLNLAFQFDPNNRMTFVLLMQDEVAACNDRAFRIGVDRLLNAVLESQTEKINQDISNPKSWSDRAETNSILDRFDEAVKDATRAIELGKTNPDYYDARALIFMSHGNWTEAIQDLTTAIQLDGEDRERWSMRGGAYIELWEFDKAIEDFTRSIELAPGDAATYSDRGVAKLNEGLYKESIVDFNEAIRLEPASGLDYLYRGNAYFYLDRYKDAIKDFTSALEIDPTNTEALSDRGASYFQLDQNAKAIADISRAIELEPEDGMLRLTRAIICFQIGRFGAAVSDCGIGVGFLLLPKATRLLTRI